MPMRNGTGPQGMGPMTGRGMGPCHSNGGYFSDGHCRKGMGRGMGFYQNPCCEISVDMKKRNLENRRELMQNQLKNIEEQLLKLEQ